MDLQNFYTEILKLSDTQLVQALTENSQIKLIKKGDVLQHIGSPSTELYFLMKGLLRGYLLDSKGKEVTDCFVYAHGTPVVSSINLGESSLICIEALEDSELIAIPFSVVLPLIGSNLEVIILYNRLLSNSLKMHWENKTVLVQYTAAERYQWFLESYPGLIKRVSHRYIASFLGMTPVSLSRIRRIVRDGEN
ncbi:Crp/Fnr family transcriptional regulator [Pseudoflavonifractor phocaeensis]|uniref:Crp/Fnr family transcriptional regulator n=1 Tax=Pseudoflavonifractor phocaeensis TaxID=1870988 RepID=UPI0019577C82|nr:Crp/Fnr family transcriptional regulator [Pseudoflavonifractor phocaeensis]MBM6888133.1 Crp/Fnr family transcriptional regulator [Pseudoflavonifractor phocaeensis]